MYDRPVPVHRRKKAPVTTAAQPISVMPTKSVPVQVQSDPAGQVWKRWTMGVVPAKVEPEPIEPVEPEILEPQVNLEALERAAHEQRLQQEIEQARQQGYEQGLQEGTQAGLQAGRQEGLAQGRDEAFEQAQPVIAQRLALIDEMIAQSADELSRLQEVVGNSLVHLAVHIARHVLGHELREPTQATLEAVRDVLRHHDDEDEHITLWLHPEDLEALKEHIDAIPTLSKVRLLGDEALTRGGVKARTAHGEIDATLQSRWHMALASLGYTPEAIDKTVSE